MQVSRANQYKNPHPRPKRYARKEDNQVLIEVLNATSNRGTYGYPRTTAVINRLRRVEGKPVWNKKRIHRVMAIHGLSLERHVQKPKRPHLGQIITIKSNMRYCSDIFEIKCWNGEKVHTAFSLDCCDREAMSFVSEKRPLYHGDIIKLMDQTVTFRFGEFVEKLPHPIQWLTDQGPQYKADQTKQYGTDWGFDVRTTPAYSPESNGMAEAFVKLFKRDYVYTNELWTAEAVLRRLPEWFADYNRHHPHSGLNMKSPLEYREAITKSAPELSL
jgi:putative transposase